MAADNKMWMGHRMMLPEARDQYAKSNKKSFPRPVWDEQRLAELENMLCAALTTGDKIKITLWSPRGPEEREVFFVKPAGAYLKCRDETGRISRILFADIMDIEIFS